MSFEKLQLVIDQREAGKKAVKSKKNEKRPKKKKGENKWGPIKYKPFAIRKPIKCVYLRRVAAGKRFGRRKRPSASAVAARLRERTPKASVAASSSCHGKTAQNE